MTRVRRCLMLLVLPGLVGWRLPNEINRLCDLAGQAYTEGKYNDAATRYAEAMRQAGDTPEIAYNLGTSYLAQRDYGPAIEALGRGLEKARTDELRERLHYNRGNAYFRVNQLEAAAREYKQALDLAPDDQDADYNYRLCLELLNQQDPSGDGGGAGQGNQPQQASQQGGDPGKSGSPQQQQQQQQGQGGGGQSNQQQSAQEGRIRPEDLSQADVDRLLRELERDEQELRAYFDPRPGSTGRSDDPNDSFYDVEQRLRELTGDSHQRDW